MAQLNKEIIGAIKFVKRRKQCEEKIYTVSDISQSKSGINLLHEALIRFFILFPPIATAEPSMAGGGGIVLDVLGERPPTPAAFLRCS